ncbi:hypothetical protein pb186bvf_005320 [Paramecium bursaria]
MEGVSPKKERDILRLFSDDNQEAILELLQKEIIPLHLIKNSKNFTVLHFTCCNNNLQLTETVINTCKKEPNFKEFINAQNKEGFTPLHLASFKGNMTMIEILLQNGADHTITNFQKQTVLHLSVQGDHVRTSYYWLCKGIHIDVEDKLGQTPLILAAIFGSHQMVNFLLPWGASIDHQTQKRQTALHLATQKGQMKIVRKLLIKGADRSIVDKSGKTALDYSSQYEAIEFMLINKIGILELCGIKQPYQKAEKQHKSMVVFVVIYLFIYLSTLLFAFPFISNPALLPIFTIINILTMLLFVYVSRSDPGYVIKKHRNLSNLFDCNPVERICPDCSQLRPQRSRHCDICQKCVDRYDHHCPWLSNCIGKKNYRVFILFLIFIVTSFILELFIQLDAYLDDTTYFTIISQEYSAMIVRDVFFYTLFILSVLLLLPVLGLLIYQVINLIRDQTTYERHIHKKGVKILKQRRTSQDLTKKRANSTETKSTSDEEYKKQPLLKEQEL